MHQLIIAGLFVLTLLSTTPPLWAADVILNEYNGVDPTSLLGDGAKSDPFFGPVEGNGGDWFELVVVTDHLDIRGWQVIVDDNNGASVATLTFSQHALLSDLRAGTIITVAEEVADDPSYDPTADDWWFNVQAGTGGSGTYISATDFDVSRNDTTIEIRAADGTSIFGPAGEPIADVGVNDREVFRLEEAPSDLITPLSDAYQDGTDSSFGAPNRFAEGTQTQDFSRLRAGLPGVDIFDPNRLIDIEFTLEKSDWDTLRMQSRTMLGSLGGDCTAQPPPSPYTFVHADVTIDGVTLTNIGVRKKGFIGSLDPVRPSMKVRFDEFADGQRLFGRDRLTLNNAKQDPARIKQCLGYELFANAGLPAPRCNFAHVKVTTTENGTPIGTQDLGIYANVEDIKDAFLKRTFGSASGNLYEGGFSSDFRPRFLPIFEKETNENTNDGTDLRVVAEILGRATDDDLLTQLDPVVNIDTFFKYWAMEALIGHWDSYSGNVNNFYLYNHAADNKFYFIPWGIDDTFGRGNALVNEGDVSPLVWARGKLPRRLYLHPDGPGRYTQTLQNLFDSVWDETAILAEIDRMQALIAPVTGDLSAYIEPIRTFVTTRRQKFNDEFVTAGPPAWTEELSNGFCVERVGNIDLRFRTNWLENVSQQPITLGVESLTGNLYGWDLTDPVGQPIFFLPLCLAGGNDLPGATDSGVVRLVFQTPNSFVFVTQAIAPLESIAPGVTYPVDGDLLNAFLFVFDILQSPPPTLFLGALAEGTLAFDAEDASTVPGQPIAGELAASVTQFTQAPGACPGDCDRNRVLTAADLVGAMLSAPGGAAIAQCSAIDRNEDFYVGMDEVDAAIERIFQLVPMPTLDASDPCEVLPAIFLPPMA